MKAGDQINNVQDRPKESILKYFAWEDYLILKNACLILMPLGTNWGVSCDV